MNALVSDQLSRLRKNLGNVGGTAPFDSLFHRKIQFGMYTSRTPYHGEYNVDKNEWIPYKLRDDKTLEYTTNLKNGIYTGGPNSSKTANEIWDYYKNPVSEKILFA